MTRITQTILFIFLVISIIACDSGSQMRTYTEIVQKPVQQDRADPHAGLNMDRSMQSQDPSVQAMLNDSVVSVQLQWDTPEGWTEQSGSGMRVVTFLTQGEHPISCTIISLGGVSGGLEQNVRRWMGQVNIAPSQSEFAKFIKEQKTIQTQGDLSVQIFDLRDLHSNTEDTHPSMIAGILALENKTVFIKLTGTKQAINQNQNQFNALIKSLRILDE